jgi:hypothetical protein
MKPMEFKRALVTTYERESRKGVKVMTLLQQIQRGMHVYDAKGDEVGTVDYVQFGDEDPRQPGAETATVNPVQRDTSTSLVESIVEVFKPDKVPEAVQARLVRHGFVLVDAPSLFNTDRYVSPDQIQSVSGDRVTLNVRKAELVRRP